MTLRTNEDDFLIPADPLLGTLVNDRYQIRSILGTGAWGRVYRATDDSEREVAVKVLHCHLVTDQQMLVRFEREARSGCSIKHHNICEVFESGVLPTRQPFIVMQYLKGENLATVLRNRGFLSTADAATVFLSCAYGLQAAHDQRIVHRDIKPANIFLEEHSAGKTIKLLDFGMAKVLAEQNDLSQTGPGFGTVHYMSPEQVTGDAVDSRSDIYSLGCVIYEALSGRKVFSGRTAFEIMEQHIRKQPERLSEKATMTSTFASRLEDIVLRSLQKEPASRFQSTADLIDALVSAQAEAEYVTET